MGVDLVLRQGRGMDNALLATWVECTILGPAWFSPVDQILGPPGCGDSCINMVKETWRIFVSDMSPLPRGQSTLVIG